MIKKLTLSASIFFCIVAPLVSQDEVDSQTIESSTHFVTEVLPVLKSKCFACHGNQPDDLKGDLDLTSLQKMLDGGESGDPSIVIGDPESSILINAIRWDDYEMPPKENDRLNDLQIAAVEKWIADGAVWPSETEIAKIEKANLAATGGEAVVTSGGLSDDWTNRRYQAEDLWAIRKLEKPAEPGGGYHVDSFVDQRLEEANVEPANNAGPDTLIRRAFYDLTGLPPEPEQIEDFRKSFEANPEEAWKTLVDKLLDSPHYGERWAQHWLDVARYADTSGYSNDFERSNSWRYRDYVVRAFNNDLPYDKFVVQQIAGDELIAEQKASKDGKNKDGYQLPDSEGIIATGFLRSGPWEHTAMTPVPLSRHNYLDDVVNGLGQTFLSTTLRCCKCHDHKFDPIPTRDYYRIYAAMATTQPSEIKAPFLDQENKSQFESQKQHVQKLLKFATAERDKLYAKREAAAKQWYKDRGIEDQYVGFQERIRSLSDDKPRRFVGLSTEEEGQVKVREQDVRIWTRRMERFQPLAQSVYNGRDWLIQSGKLRPANKNQEKNRTRDNSESFIYTGGDVNSPAEQVTPGVLSCVGVGTSSGNEEDPFRLPNTQNHRRLELARWIANPENGLAVRSIVNRVWHYHFGRGLAANPNNFGGTGARPTHPELLDWLCVEFVESGWSIKHLHRLIMNSNVYRRSTDHPSFAELKNQDPSNLLLAVFEPRRMSAEEIRDTMLSATGELNPEMGGLPVRPEINLEVALSPRMIQFSIAPAYQPERLPEHRNRRSLYAYRIRGLHDPLMAVLDKPNPNDSCELRDSASTTPQVFALWNGDVVTKRSIALATRLRNEKEKVEDQIRRGYRLALGTSPSDELLTALATHYKEMVAYHKSNQPEPIAYPTQITRSLVEEFSGDPFEYVELLDVYEDYVPDKGPADVDAETRALADICLLIFNSNEFMYVY